MTCPIPGSKSQLFVYLRTADHCQLNCQHCFTGGDTVPKKFFDPEATTQFFHKLRDFNPNFENCNVAFHGGEPFLAPSSHMVQVWNDCKDLWPDLRWSIQTNLTLPITEDRWFILDTVCDGAWGTSWDKDIRWNGNILQEQRWVDNVKSAIAQGHVITVMVSVTKSLIQMEPIEVIDYLAGLGVQHVNFERVTPDGNALQNSHIFASNAEVDLWFAKMWEQQLEHRTYDYIHNMFFDSLLTSMVYNTFSGCRCRECEQKILTLTADGRVGGCPNSATNNFFGTIADPIDQLWFSEGRMKNVQKEILRNPECYGCPVFDICNGDCHQLAWQGNVCAAPKTLMTKLKQEPDMALFRKVLGDFMGQE